MATCLGLVDVWPEINKLNNHIVEEKSRNNITMVDFMLRV